MWLNKHNDIVFGFPSLVRFSWKTCKDMLVKSNQCTIEWRDPKIGEEEKANEKQGNLKHMFLKDVEKRGKNCALTKLAGLDRKI